MTAGLKRALSVCDAYLRPLEGGHTESPATDVRAARHFGKLDAAQRLRTQIAALLAKEEAALAKAEAVSRMTASYFTDANGVPLGAERTCFCVGDQAWDREGGKVVARFAGNGWTLP